MVFWKRSQPTEVPRAAANAGMDHSEDMIAEVDEEPDERKQWTPAKLHDTYTKTRPTQQLHSRRESLLTRQLHSETEHSDEDHPHQPPRTLSTHSTWSNPSNASTAELTSDDGRSMPSPATSPPLAPTQAYNAMVVREKSLDKHVRIVGQEETLAQSGAGAEKTLEATLGRKRCIMFACRGKDEAKPETPSPTSAPALPQPAPASPPKRKCAIKFACPMLSNSKVKVVEAVPVKRPVSPPTPQRRSSALQVELASKSHRGSDSTVTHASPKSVRKSLTAINVPTTTSTEAPRPSSTRKQSNDSDETGTEAMRFHEFASSEDEPEEWITEASCHRSRLTIDDTLKKEIDIRKVCEEVDEEVLEEDDDEEADGDGVDEAEGLDNDEDEEANDDEDQDEEEDEDDESDAGFHSDDEHGFAASDSEGEDSDHEWWRPGGSTAATSTEHLDRLSIQHKGDDKVVAASLNSMSSGQLSPRSFKRPSYRRHRNHARSLAIPIDHTVENDELPDSTDFVCGTLDEDRPLEQAYLNRMKDLEAAKHKARPQDIDPTFPTSDPEMDEEDDEDLEDPEESEQEENMMHGSMDELHEGSTLRRRPSPHRRATSHMHRSPPPPARHPSPAPTKRHTKHHSPPPLTKRVSARSPPPRRLFGQSPRRGKSPAPHHRMTSPPNSRISSPSAATTFINTSKALAERPQLTHTASLPRGGFLLSRLGQNRSDDGEASDTAGANNDVPKRGAIDIVKGLEKKRQRRREKMYQKMCAKAAAKGEKAYKVKPGKGCERMREVGLQLQEYHGKAQHILSL
ncbi:hypothetical protein B0A55_05873 [Friedmanniomyces simplex]|uniref:Extensin domain-containing protein n=1 Tax=Friedmanniomyces simplex TaxID=329884 RepID=A0A4U0XI21_9PEZI|nr:hypothetical protein B0A55_05873 [Friedmanniomyces simplex]